MFRVLFNRILLILIILFIVSLISYIIFMRDPANFIFATPSFWSGYPIYMSNLLQGDLGISYTNGENIGSVLMNVLPKTLELCFSTTLVAIIIGFPLGILSALNSKNIIGKLIARISTLGIVLPIIWIAPILIYFSTRYQWEISAIGQVNLLYEITPITGFTLIDVWFIPTEYRLKAIQNVLQHIILPTLVLSLLPTMEVIRFVGSRVSYILKQNYINLSIVQGWSLVKIFFIHILRNTIPLFILQIPQLIILIFTQAMLIESIFAWPGLGRWLINSVIMQDYNSISTAIIVISLFIIGINLSAELFTFLLDPFKKKGWYGK